MENLISLFCIERQYPDAAIKALTDSWKQIISVSSVFNAWKEAETTLRNAKSEAGERIKLLDLVSEKTTVNRQTLHLLFYICQTEYLKECYQKAGISLSIYEDSIYDLKCKMFECYELYGVWGCRVSPWLDAFFTLKRFALGRMQYDVRYCEDDLILECGKKIKTGEKVLAVHIPVSDKPFSRENRLDSYKKAYNFFKEQFPDGVIPFCVTSWLLFPENKKILPKTSNIIEFMSEFTIVKSGTYQNYNELWRIFGKQYDGNAKTLPRKTSLQCAYADWVAQGQQTGFGTGCFLYDGKTFTK